MKLWVDDERQAPKGWVRVMSARVAVIILSKGNVTELSLDHDLGKPDSRGSGYDAICWLEQVVLSGLYLVAYGKAPPGCACHSMNPVGRAKIEAAIRSIEKYMNNLEKC